MFSLLYLKLLTFHTYMTRLFFMLCHGFNMAIANNVEIISVQMLGNVDMTCYGEEDMRIYFSAFPERSHSKPKAESTFQTEKILFNPS